MKCIYPVVVARDGEKDTLCGERVKPGTFYCVAHKGDINPHVNRDPHLTHVDPNPYREDAPAHG
jgi:hypothetical protein